MVGDIGLVTLSNHASIQQDGHPDGASAVKNVKVVPIATNLCTPVMLIDCYRGPLPLIFQMF